jgi:N6-adenosine-specific RNA methylase IME4/predicted transcriptional regulator
MKDETPDCVHGRLMEAVHISGYTFERACDELSWLLDQDRWKTIGSGFSDVDAFLDTLTFSEFKIAAEKRKTIAKQLAAIHATQSATARLLGVNQSTISRGLNANALEGAENNTSNAEENNPTNANAWSLIDADPSREAKRIARNEQRELERAQLRNARPTPSALTGRFSLVYADPPWQYEHIATESRAIENQYPTMTLEAICGLDVPAADDAVLFLWATSPKLAEAIQVVEAWDFNYRTCAVWDKGLIGMGYFFRQRHELLLVATRGDAFPPAPPNRPPSIIHSRRGKHSEKPKAVYELLERMYPAFTEQDRVELFARQQRPGWSIWTNEPMIMANQNHVSTSIGSTARMDST